MSIPIPSILLHFLSNYLEKHNCQIFRYTAYTMNYIAFLAPMALVNTTSTIPIAMYMEDSNLPSSLVILSFCIQVNEKCCRLRMATYRDGVKRKELRDFGTTLLCILYNLCDYYSPTQFLSPFLPSLYLAILNLQDFSFSCLLSFLMP